MSTFSSLGPSPRRCAVRADRPGDVVSIRGGSPSFSNMMLFWASFFTLIAAGMGFSIRGDILADWGRQFGFTQTDLGIITGQGLAGFGFTIIFFSFFSDLLGYGNLMVIAFLLHALSVVPHAGARRSPIQHYGKDGAFWCLYLGAWAFSLGNGTCEAVINPLTATLFPHNKTHWLNILHAGWPGGLVLGALVNLGLNQLPSLGLPNVGWQVRWGIVLLPDAPVRRDDARPAASPSPRPRSPAFRWAPWSSRCSRRSCCSCS